MKYKLDKSAHSVFALYYHLVIVVKYRRKAMYSYDIRERLKEIVWDLSTELGIDVVAQEPTEDHYHLFFKATPKPISSMPSMLPKEYLHGDYDRNFQKQKIYCGEIHSGLRRICNIRASQS